MTTCAVFGGGELQAAPVGPRRRFSGNPNIVPAETPKPRAPTRAWAVSHSLLDSPQEFHRFCVSGLASFGFLGEILAQVKLRAAGLARLSDENGGDTVVRCEVVENVGFGLLQDLVEFGEARRGGEGLRKDDVGADAVGFGLLGVAGVLFGEIVPGRSGSTVEVGQLDEGAIVARVELDRFQVVGLRRGRRRLVVSGQAGASEVAARGFDPFDLRGSGEGLGFVPPTMLELRRGKASWQKGPKVLSGLREIAVSISCLQRRARPMARTPLARPAASHKIWAKWKW
jgi:hypothetical protein